jgi:hypothetical protein
MPTAGTPKGVAVLLVTWLAPELVTACLSRDFKCTLATFWQTQLASSCLATLAVCRWSLTENVSMSSSVTLSASLNASYSSWKFSL